MYKHTQWLTVIDWHFVFNVSFLREKDTLSPSFINFLITLVFCGFCFLKHSFSFCTLTSWVERITCLSLPLSVRGFCFCRRRCLATAAEAGIGCSCGELVCGLYGFVWVCVGLLERKRPCWHGRLRTDRRVLSSLLPHRRRGCQPLCSSQRRHTQTHLGLVQWRHTNTHSRLD